MYYSTKRKTSLKDTSHNISLIQEIAPPLGLSDKDGSPLWSYTNNMFSKVYGFVYDWDFYTRPDNIPENTHYYWHETHSGKYRLIFPFDEPITFKNNSQYKDAYRTMGHILNITEYDSKCENINRWWYCRQPHQPLHEVKGHNIKPAVIDEQDYVNGINLGKPSLTLTGNITSLYRIFSKIRALHEAEDAYNVDYRYIRNRNCMLHDHKQSVGMTFNDGNLHLRKTANIYSHHESCVSKIYRDIKDTYLDKDAETNHKEQYDELNYVLEQMNHQRNIKWFTIIYLSLAVGSGKISLASVMACYLHKKLLKDMLLLSYADMKNAIAHKLLLTAIYGQGICAFNKSFYIYNGAYYEPKEKEEVKNEIKNVINSYVYYITFGKGWNKVANDLSSNMLDSCYIKKEETPAIVLDNCVLTFDNGRVDIREHSPRFFTTSTNNYDYDSHADCALWKNTLTQYFGNNEDKKRTLQEWFGYCLTKDRSLEKMLVLYGVSRAGKGTIAEVLCDLVPSVSDSLSALTDDRKLIGFEKGHIYFSDEGLDGHEKKTVLMNTLKKLSSTAPMSTRPLYSNDMIEIKTFPKIMTVINDPKSIGDVDEGLENRMIAFKFTKSFKDREDRNLKKKLKAERSGILNWAIEGYQRLYAQGKFSDHNDREEFTRELHEEVLAFKADIFAISDKENATVFKATDLRNLYNIEMNDRLNPTTFGRKMREAFDKSVKVTKSTGNYYQLGEPYKLYEVKKGEFEL